MTIITILPIVIAPDPRLKIKCRPIEHLDGDISRLMDNMIESMYAAKGIGLSAPQVGIGKRVIVVDAAKKEEKPSPIRMANPEIVRQSEEMVCREEGCLSFPDYYADISRPAEIRVSYLDHNNKRREMDADGLLARCILHEIDHLDGVLFVDYLSHIKRNIIIRKLVKNKKIEAGR